MQTFQVKLGKDLSKDELDFINKRRYEEFKSKTKISPTDKNEDGVNRFVFLRDERNKILSFGKIEVLPIKHIGKIYIVLCISTIISSPKGKGFGSSLMEEVKRYVKGEGMAMIGFCETRLLPFYRSCGFEIVKPEDNQFVYIDSEGKIIPNIVPGEVFYMEREDKIITKILLSGNKTVEILRIEEGL